MECFNIPDINDEKNLNIFYQKLLDQVPDLIFKLLWQKGNKFTVSYCSESVQEVYEMSAAEFKANPGVALRRRIMAQDWKAFISTLQLSRKKMVPWDCDFRVSLPKKGKRWLRVYARPELLDNGNVIFYGRISDITYYKQKETDLKKSEERVIYALEAASEGIWDYDMVNDTIFFSSQAMKILGKEEKDTTLTLPEWTNRIFEEDRSGHQRAREDYLEGKSTRFENIYRIKDETGNYIWVLSRGQVVEHDDYKNPTRAIGTIKDITHLKEKEIELGNTINIIGDQNNRLSNFAHIVSHNLRSHAGNLKMLLDVFKTAKEEEKDEMLHHLEAISDGLSITINHLKELVEIQTEVKNVKEKLNLRHYLKNILNILHNEIKKHGVTIEINIPLDVTVNYNPAYLESVLLNFTTNAIKYSSPRRQPFISYDFEVINGEKVLSVSDNGLGIDMKKHKNALFGMYKTFHKHQNSRGIGLFITKNQVEAMGGRIKVISEVDKGTTFKLFFNEKI